MTAIIEYKAGWNPQHNKGRIFFRLVGGKTVNLDLDNPAEFAAILTILSSSKQATIQKGEIWTGGEIVE